MNDRPGYRAAVLRPDPAIVADFTPAERAILQQAIDREAASYSDDELTAITGITGEIRDVFAGRAERLAPGQV